MLNFGLIGAAGYVAPRHMKAVSDIGGNLAVSLDKSDSVGILDSYFPNCSFFTESERFERFLFRGTERGSKLDYMAICSPNYLHDSHIRMALRNGISAICEKPLVVNGKNISYLKSARDFYGKDVNCILQLRLHDQVIALKKSLSRKKRYRVNLEYITSRGSWYDYSWKSDSAKSGGLPMNIGIHLFDLLLFLFGELKSVSLSKKSERTYSGYLKLERADVEWVLSTDSSMLPTGLLRRGIRTHRVLTFDKMKFDFSSGFNDLHKKSYEEIIMGNGFKIEDCEQSIDLANKIFGLEE